MNLDPRLNRTADFIKLMAHAIRLRILILLAKEESLSVSAMMDSLSITQALLSHHLIKMRKGKILLQTRKGREIHYSVSDPALVVLLIKLLRAYH